MGPNAYQTLSAAGLTIITGVTGTIREAVERYRSGQLQAVAGPMVAAHTGAGGAPPAGTSQAPGPGGGRGRGRGWGWGGGGMGRGMPLAPSEAAPGESSQDLEALKNETTLLTEEVEKTLRRLEDLEKKGS